MAVSQVGGSGLRTSRPAPHIKRRGVVYCILTRPVDRNGIPIPGAAPEVGYIGKSRQTAWEREQQHRACQPFSDLIVGGSFTLEQGVWDDAELAAREQWWIRNGAPVVPNGPKQRPRYNYEFNTDYEGRIEIWLAQQHRRNREPGWVPQQNRVPRQRAPHRVRPVVRRSSRSRSWLRRWWLRRRVPVVAWSTVWLALFAVFWTAGRSAWQGWEGPRHAAVGASLVAVGLLVARRRDRRKRRRNRRRR